MQSLQPQNLTDAELLHYAHLQGYDKLPASWVEELAKRLERYEHNSYRANVRELERAVNL